MIARTHLHRLVAIGLLAAFATTLVAPAAFAGNGHHKRYKKVCRSPRVVERVVYAPQSHVVVRQSSAAPVIAGLIGGIILGVAVSNAHASVHAAPAYATEPAHYYYDPVYRTRYANFAECRARAHYYNGPRVIQVIEVGSGECVETYRYKNGGWRDHAGNDWHD